MKDGNSRLKERRKGSWKKIRKQGTKEDSRRGRRVGGGGLENTNENTSRYSNDSHTAVNES